MARHKKSQAPEEDTPRLDISSLIDICFLLLIYFLVTTQIVQKEQELSGNIPTPPQASTPVELGSMFIILEANGQVSIKNENGLVELVESETDSRQLPHLSKRLKLHKSISDISSQEALVSVQVHQNTVYQRVIDVLNAIAGAKITNITFFDSSHEK